MKSSSGMKDSSGMKSNKKVPSTAISGYLEIGT